MFRLRSFSCLLAGLPASTAAAGAAEPLDPRLTAYWDYGNCGPMGDDYQSHWCGGAVEGQDPYSSCQRTVAVATSICLSGVAELVSVRGTGSCCRLRLDGCDYAYFAQWQCAAPEASTCFEDYARDIDGWMELGGAVTEYAERERMPEEYWEKMAEQQGLDRTMVGSGYDAWVDSLYGAAEMTIRRCRSAEGRLWAWEFAFREYLETVLVNATALAGHVMELLSVRFGEVMPILWRGSICSPSSCEAEAMAQRVIPRYIAHVMGTPHRLPSFSHLLAVEEFGIWSDLKIDFAVVGVDGCGTHSIRSNLGQHPGISFNDDESENFIYETFQKKTLPLKSQVGRFNAAWEDSGDRLRGHYNPSLWNLPLARQVIGRIPGLKVILILCDPVNRLEKRFFLYHSCQSLTTGEAAEEHSALVAGNECKASIADVTRMQQFLDQMRIHSSLPEMSIVFIQRLLTLHLEGLRVFPQFTYNRIVDFLGLPPFREGTVFPRVNARKGHRTDLCGGNGSLVRRVQAVLRKDYMMLDEVYRLAGVMPPPDLVLRQTRCDSPDELSETAADAWWTLDGRRAENN